MAAQSKMVVFILFIDGGDIRVGQKSILLLAQKFKNIDFSKISSTFLVLNSSNILIFKMAAQSKMVGFLLCISKNLAQINEYRFVHSIN
jgi:hypothetical protein